jgi:serine carboxypeptidase 1
MNVLQEVQAGRLDVNIAGFAMGNSWISPIDSTLTWGPLLYQMVGKSSAENFNRLAMLCKEI